MFNISPSLSRGATKLRNPLLATRGGWAFAFPDGSEAAEVLWSYAVMANNVWEVARRIIGGALWAVIIAGSVWTAWYFYFDLPDTRALLKVNPETTATLELREQEIRAKGSKPRSVMTWRRLGDISPFLQHAVLLAEDDTFYQHNGFDVEQMKRALEVNWERKKFAFGASTITQQLARTLYLSPKKSLLRKMKEALITRRLEKTLPKKRIFELYLNVVEWGPNIYGAEAAAQHYFGVSADDLTPNQAIALAVILPSPRRWNPAGESKFITSRRAILYDRMLRAKYLPVIVPSGDALVEPDGPAGQFFTPLPEPAGSPVPSNAPPDDSELEKG